MSEKSSGNKKTGRPPKEIDWESFEKLCGLQCTQREIASFFDISVNQLHERVLKQYKIDNYMDVYERFTDKGKISLRRNQLKLSQRNATMAIWLGKNWLGQVDCPTEMSVSPETIQQFDAMMNQINRAQESIGSCSHMDTSSFNSHS